MLALNRRIPYRSWRWWHKLSGPLFVIVILHWLSIRSPIALASPAGIWMAIMAALGVAGAFYKLLLYPLLSSHAEYRLVDVSSTSSAVLLELEPTRRSIAFEPGQFAFLSIKHDGLREPHPFTIARAGGSDGRVAFVVRALGDHTGRLVRDARPGMLADVYAPFGRFERRPGAVREIWIAGGVGVTPFIAWLGDENGTDMDRATFFHFYTPGRELPDKIDLESMARAHGVELVSVADGPGSPAFRKRFAELVTEAGPTQVQVSFCGPAGLLRQVRALMRKQGMGEHQLQYEKFEFR